MSLPTDLPGSLAGIAPQSGPDPAYPAPWTTGQAREGLRDNGQARIVCLAPSVNLTPVGGQMVPVPYQVWDECDHVDGYSTGTFYTRQRVLRYCDKTAHVHGDEAGTGGGVISGTHGDVCEPIGNAPKVRVEGSPVVRHLDRFWMNARNTVGEALFARDMSLPAAPVDDDPLPGSVTLVRAGGSSPRVMSDAEPDTSLYRPGATLALTDTTGLLERAPVVDPPVVEEPPTFYTWKNLGKVAGAEELGGGGPEDPVADLLVLGTLIYFAVRISQEQKRERCLVGQYGKIEGICRAEGGETHHIVPDMVYRLGARPTGAAMDSVADRIPNAPTLNQGMSICLDTGQHRTDEAAIHKSLNPTLKALGSDFDPAGTAPMRTILRMSVAALQSVDGIDQQCKITAAIATSTQAAPISAQPGRTTTALPSPAAQRVLAQGHY